MARSSVRWRSCRPKNRNPPRELVEPPKRWSAQTPLLSAFESNPAKTKKGPPAHPPKGPRGGPQTVSVRNIMTSASLARPLRSSTTPSQSEESGAASDRSRLFLVTGRRPVVGALTPIAGTASQPVESRMIGRAFEHPAEIVAIVGREPKLGIVSHDTGQRVQGLARHEAAPLMPALWPRVGKED